MAVDLRKNGAALQQAYQDVVDGKVETNWALFTYEGNSNILRVSGTGDGGLEELQEELNSGKMMFAFCRVKDPNSGLPKYVLINWTGEGVQDSRKGVCANHLSSIASFLRGAHLTIQARTEQDVDPDLILQKVSKASGANFSFQQRDEAFRDRPTKPAASVYRKTNAVEEIQQSKKDEFWRKTQEEEEERRREENRRVQEAKEKEERERREKEAQQQQLRVQDEREERRFRQEAQEVKALIAQRSLNPPDVFEQTVQRSTVAESTPVKLQSRFLSDSLPSAAVVSKLPVSPKLPQENLYTEEEEAEWSDEFDDDDAAEAPSAQDQLYDTPPQPISSQDQLYDTPPQPISSQDQLYDTPPQPISSQDQLYDTPPQPISSQDQQQGERGVCARALYDYQAADDTEITFDPGEVITHIDMLDEGWWRGYGPDGHYGMFPANYVELL